MPDEGKFLSVSPEKYTADKREEILQKLREVIDQELAKNPKFKITSTSLALLIQNNKDIFPGVSFNGLYKAFGQNMSYLKERLAGPEK